MEHHFPPPQKKKKLGVGCDSVNTQLILFGLKHHEHPSGSLSIDREIVGHTNNQSYLIDSEFWFNPPRIFIPSKYTCISHFHVVIKIIWEANYPYSQLRAEMRRTQLQRVWEAGMQERLWLPAKSTHYDHGAQPEIKSEWFWGKLDGLENPRGTAESQCTIQLTYGPGRVLNQTHLVEGLALQANHAQYVSL